MINRSRLNPCIVPCLVGGIMASVLGAHAAEPLPTMPSAVRAVERVDVQKYMGRWYEIARIPNRYQDRLVAVTCDYDLRDNGTIGVVNTGRLDRIDGKERKSTAKAWTVDGANGSQWEVQFIWPLTADYWIIDLDPDYRYAVVGQPCRTHLWILSRTPTMDEATYQTICDRLKQHGYDPDKLVRTPQPPPPDAPRGK